MFGVPRLDPAWRVKYFSANSKTLGKQDAW